MKSNNKSKIINEIQYKKPRRVERIPTESGEPCVVAV